MLRMRLSLCIFMIGLMIILSGCLKGEQTGKLDVPEDITVVDEEADMDEMDNSGESDSETEDDNEMIQETTEMVSRDLYLFDSGGLVVPQQFELPKSDSAAKQVLEYLVVDGPVSEMLPSGFQAVLPAGTEILDINLKDDGVLIVDVSEEFKDYPAENELKILQAMTHTLTQFDTIKRVVLWINGEEQTEMPVNGTPISQGFSRANGINLDVTRKPDLMKSEAVTIFYPKNYDEAIHFVPVTTYLEQGENSDLFTSIIESLLRGPSQPFGTLDVFNDKTRLIGQPSIKDGVVQLKFSDDILQSKEEAMIADEVMALLVKNLTEQEIVEAVSISIENYPNIISENGTPYDKPVTAQDVMGTEKM